MPLNLFRGLQAIIATRYPLISRKIPVVALTKPHPSGSISLANIKVLINVSHSHAPVVGYDAHRTLANVADLVVVVQELNVGSDCCLGIFGSRASIG